jgi:enoyl-CoA hydratase/carnithine racemase
MNRSLTRLTQKRLLSTQIVASPSPDKLSSILAEKQITEPTPKSIHRIPHRTQPIGNASAVIRDIGLSRRVFLLDPALDSEELEGLAHHIKILTKNAGINSVLIANDDTDDRANNCLPAMVTSDRQDDLLAEMMKIKDFRHKTKHVSQGYSPLKVYKDGIHVDKASLHELLVGLTKLARACRGDDERAKVPVVTIPHGKVTDGGYAICQAAYVMTTDETSFCILNPSRGLALDPIGLSYMLPRLGWDYKQHSAQYPGCGILLGCSGIEITCHDMVYTGLATHYMNSIRRLGPLERAISETVPWNQQALFKAEPLVYGQQPIGFDENEPARNIQLGSVIEAATTYSVFHAILDQSEPPDAGDPTTTLDYDPWLGTDQPTPLIDRAIVFANIFREESTILGIVDRFRQLASSSPSEDYPRNTLEAAAQIVQGFESQSPLALSVTYELLKIGSRHGQTVDSCIDRETRTQMNMFSKPDFKNWAEHAVANGEDVPFKGWVHKDLKAVSPDEVEEIIEASKELPPLIK